MRWCWEYQLGVVRCDRMVTVTVVFDFFWAALCSIQYMFRVKKRYKARHTESANSYKVARAKTSSALMFILLEHSGETGDGQGCCPSICWHSNFTLDPESQVKWLYLWQLPWGFTHRSSNVCAPETSKKKLQSKDWNTIEIAKIDLVDGPYLGIQESLVSRAGFEWKGWVLKFMFLYLGKPYATSSKQ